MRIATVAATLLAALALAAEARAQGSEDTALGYLPSDASAAVSLDTDLAGDQLRGLDALLRRVGSGGLESELRALLREDLGLDLDRDVRPLLGNRLAVGYTGSIERTGVVVGALEVEDPGVLAATLRRTAAVTPAGEVRGAPAFRLAGLGWLAARGSSLVFADTRAALESALARAGAGGGLGGDELDRGIGDLPRESFARGYVDPNALVGPGEMTGLPWERALRTVGAAASAGEGGLRVEASGNTDPDGLSEDDLPIAAGEESPALVALGWGGSAVGVRDPAQPALFLVRGLGEALLDPGRVARAFGVDVERDLLGLLGPEAVLTADARGAVATRFDLADPTAFARSLERALPLALTVGPLLSELFDPLAVGVQEGTTRLRPVRGREDLYLVTGAGERVVLGLVGGRFVTAPDERAARRIAVESPVPFDGPGGSVAFVLGAGALAGGLPTPGVGPLNGSAEASTERVHVRLSLPVAPAG